MSVDHAKGCGVLSTRHSPSKTCSPLSPSHAEKRTIQAKTARSQRCDGLMPALTRF
ncbi:hypothetical protein BDM02DRAFT_3108506 [Thelephora ganbajun]|uniref:Uncharacterized protein n=1 Tax=Thelephora ganbajun TaxID=370292 RepID=A0ACB6ZUT2_THEGA|nr:hypothetical protein BDM02DRAFT_3108506 [Thelephora ganbajun]